MTAVDGPDTVEVVPLPVGFTVKVYAVVAARLEIVQLCVPVGIVTVLATVQLPLVALTVLAELTV